MIVLINDIYFLQLSLPAGKVNNFLTNIRKLFDWEQTNVVRVAIASEDFFFKKFILNNIERNARRHIKKIFGCLRNRSVGDR